MTFFRRCLVGRSGRRQRDVVPQHPRLSREQNVSVRAVAPPDVAQRRVALPSGVTVVTAGGRVTGGSEYDPYIRHDAGCFVKDWAQYRSGIVRL